MDVIEMHEEANMELIADNFWELFIVFNHLL